MPLILWGASGFAKRYAEETGRETVNAVFSAVPVRHPVWQMRITPTGYAETYSILLRKHNGGILNARTFTEAMTALWGEVEDADFGILSNSADAVILAAYLQFQRTSAARCLLVSADKRLLPAF